jgi:ABC-2 type transport system permease protein
MLLAGVLLPLSMGPAWLITIAHFNPMYYAVEAARVLGSGVIVSVKVLQGFLVMAPLTVLVLWWATRVYRKAVS